MNGPRGTQTTIGQRLGWARERTGLSQRKLASKLRERGVDIESHSTIGRYENDQVTPPADFLAALATLARVDGHWLLTGDGPMERRDPTEAERLVGEFRKLLGPIPPGRSEPL